MRRAVALAGGGAGVIAVGGRIVVSVIFVPHFRAPFGLIRQHLLRIDDRPLLRTQLLPELGGTRRAHLGALTAGNALFRIDMRAVSGCGHIRRVEQLAGAQRVAGADAAVADAVDLVLAVNIRDLVHKAVFLGALQDLHDLFARCRARFVGLDGVGRHVTDGNAYVLFQMAAALIAHSRDRRQEQAPIAYLPSYLSSQCDRCSRSTDFCSDGIAFSTGTVRLSSSRSTPTGCAMTAM